MNNRPIHTAIKNLDAKTAIELIKAASNADINDTFGEELSTLQKAAGGDMVNVVLALLAKGANIDGRNHVNSKTPFYLAIEAGHYLIARILLILGADVDLAHAQMERFNQTELAIPMAELKAMDNSMLTLSLFNWMINNNDIKKIEQHLPQAMQRYPEIFSNYLGALLELATQLKHTEIIKFLLKKLTTPRHIPENLTAAYWQIINGNTPEAVLPFLPTSDDWQITLRQLFYNNKNYFKQYSKLADETNKKKFNINVESSLNGESLVIYEAAKQGDLTQLKDCCTTEDDFYNALVIAFDYKNLIALNTLATLTTMQLPFSKLITENHHDLVIYLLINSQTDLYEAVLDVVKKPDILKEFIDNYWSLKGLQKSLVDRGIKRKIRVDDSMVKLIKQSRSLDEKGFAKYLIARLSQKYQIKLENTDYVEIGNGIHIVLKDKITNEMFEKLLVRLTRFRITIENVISNNNKNNNGSFLPSDMWHAIFKFLSAQQKDADLPTINHYFNNLMLYTPIDKTLLMSRVEEKTVIKTRKQHKQTEEHVEAILNVIALMEVYDNKWRIRLLTMMILLGILLDIVMVPCVYGADAASNRITDVKWHLKNDIVIRGTTCYSIANGAFNSSQRSLSVNSGCNDYSKLYDQCSTWCGQYSSSTLDRLNFTCGAAFSGGPGTALLLALVFAGMTGRLINLSFRYRHAPDEIKAAQREVVRFNRQENYPWMDDDVKIKDLLVNYKDLLDTKKNEIKSLNDILELLSPSVVERPAPETVVQPVNTNVIIELIDNDDEDRKTEIKDDLDENKIVSNRNGYGLLSWLKTKTAKPESELTIELLSDNRYG